MVHTGRMRIVTLAPALTVAGDCTIDPAHPHAFAANAGWVNARGKGTNEDLGRSTEGAGDLANVVF